MKKFLLLLLTIALSVSMSLPVFADTFTDEGNAACLVTAEVSSEYVVSVPATLDLSCSGGGDVYTGTYSVGVKGNLSPSAVVSVIPRNNSITMTGQESGVTASGTVNQHVSEWVSQNPSDGQMVIGVDDYAMTEGSVEVELTEADVYHGNIVFDFSLAGGTSGGTPVDSGQYTTFELYVDGVKYGRTVTARDICAAMNEFYNYSTSTTLIPMLEEAIFEEYGEECHFETAQEALYYIAEKEGMDAEEFYQQYMEMLEQGKDTYTFNTSDTLTVDDMNIIMEMAPVLMFTDDIELIINALTGDHDFSFVPEEVLNAVEDPNFVITEGIDGFHFSSETIDWMAEQRTTANLILLE